MPDLPEEAVQAAAPRLRHGNRNRQNIYEVRDDGTETFVAVVMDPDMAERFVAMVNRGAAEEEKTRADERRKVAEEIAATLDEKAARVTNEARNAVKAGATSIADRMSRRSGAFSYAAVIARQIGGRCDPR